MISHYRIKEEPRIKEVISIENLNKLKLNKGFLVFIVNTMVEEEINEIVDQIGSWNLEVPSVVVMNDMTVTEVVERVELREKEAEQSHIEEIDKQFDELGNESIQNEL